MKRNVTVGLVLVGVGAFLILQKALHLTIDIWQFIWPFFLLVPGISMHIDFFKERRDAGSLVVAGILTVYGLLFLINAITAGEYLHMLTFVYPLGIGIGFWESFALGDKKNSSLSIAVIFLVISLYMLLNDAVPGLVGNFKYYIIPALLVVIGMIIIIKDKTDENRK
jgi:hypothetical protein